MKTSNRDLFLNAGFALALVVLAAVGWLSYRDMKAMSESDTLEAHTYTVIHEMDGLLSALMDAEAGLRGFVITNDDKYLEPYHNSLGVVDAKLESLKSLTRDDPRLQERLRVLEPLVRDRIAQLKEIVRLQRTSGHEAASYAIMSKLNQSLMDQIRKQVADAQDEESRLLRERAEAKAAATRRTVEAVAVGAILSFALLLAVFVLLRKEIAQRVIAEGELRVHRDRLEELVQEKTQDVSRQRELLRVTLSSIGDAVLATDTAGGITFLNAMAATLTGWQEEQALGQPVQNVLRILDERTHQRAEDIVARVLDEGSVVTLADHTGLLARDGRETPIEDSAAPIKDSAGHVIGAVIVFHDVTEKRRAHESLLEAEERFRLLFQQAAVGIKRLDRQGHMLDVNDKFCDILGYSREELLQLSLKDITHAEDLPLEQAKLSMLLSRQSPTYSIEKRCLRKDGNVIWVRVTASLPAGAQGEFQWWMSVVEDITKRKRTEEELRQSEQRLRTILDALPVAVFLSDRDGNVVFTNSAVDRIWGMSAHVSRGSYGEYKGRWLETGEPVQPEQWALARALVSGQAFTNDLVQLQDPQGGQKIINNFALPIRGDAGQLTGVVVVTEDVTERVRSQEQIRLAKEAAERTAAELARSNRDLEQFAYVSSHDLQEPLRMVAGFMQLLEQKYQGKLDPAGEQYIHFAVDGAKRMQRLIEDLLAYSRVSARGRELTPTDSGQALQHALANLQMSIEQSQARITHGELPIVLADGSQLAQVFQNLIGNAIKFHGDQPPAVHVEARRDGNWWLFSVQDNGIGIAPEFGEKVFMIFQRLHAKDKYPGTGIGLAICKKIIDRHGGRIWVESALGQGATFYFTLPA